MKLFPTAEDAANEEIKEALIALQRAIESAYQAGYGSIVLGALEEAQLSAQYAHDTALGRN